MLRIDESWTAGDNRILTAAGESESLTASGESKSLIAAGDCKNLLIIENENLHSVGGQKLGVYKSSEVMRIFMLLTVRNWEHTNLLRF